MTALPTGQPYGLWTSAVSPASLASGIRLSEIQWDSDGQTLVWLEGRSGQGVLVCASATSSDAAADLTTDLSVRAQLGYGGGEFTTHGGHVFFVVKSGRIYRQPLREGLARAITPEFGHSAAPTIAPDGAWMLFVHSYEQTDALAIVDTAGRHWPQRLVSGHDFYMQPRWHLDGQRIAYIAWDHPQMPWDGTVLYLARLQQSGNALPTVAEATILAGGTNTAIFQPEFSPDGRWLSYISDVSGWGHLHLYDLVQDKHYPLTQGEAEHSTPAWVQGLRTYGWSRDSAHIYIIRNEGGFARLYRYTIATNQTTPVAGLESYTWLSQPAISPTSDSLAVVAAASTQPPRLVVLNLDSDVSAVWEPASARPKPAAPTVRILRRSQAEVIPPGDLAAAQPIIWESDGGTMVHGLLYLPPGTTAETLSTGNGPRPPAIIRIHGGPTAQAVATYVGEVQFFTSRGYAVLTVNYRGSTGYGRAYMEALRGNWGMCDVEDTITGAHYLTQQGLVDGQRLVLLGGSAGGYTLYEVLCRAPGMFRAAICLFGVSNLFTLVTDTHKFEARYMDSLVGPLPAASTRYRERSPVFHAELLRDPIAIFQGDSDTVVPRSQSDTIVAALKRNGVPHEYHVYEGEGHGWRKPQTIEAFYKAVEAFLRQYVLFA